MNTHGMRRVAGIVAGVVLAASALTAGEAHAAPAATHTHAHHATMHLLGAQALGRGDGPTGTGGKVSKPMGGGNGSTPTG